MEDKKIHFIGICGMGMSALAVMLQDMGAIVSGSDEGFYEPAASYLKRNNISILSPYKKENIPENVDLIIIGKHSKLNKENNDEVKSALNSPQKVKSFPEILRELTKERENIVVAGSYGKSTCVSLLAYCLIKNGINTGYFLGANSNDLEKSAQIGTKKYFILEGDEYPAFGGISKFLYLQPKQLLLTSAEHDHINVFPTLENYLEPYKKLVQLLPKDGLLVAGINNPNIKEVIKESKAKIITYGMDEKADWYSSNIKYGEITTFDLFKRGIKIVSLSTRMLGRHNIENIVGTSTLLLENNLLSPLQLEKSVSSFNGLKRRLDLKTEKSSVLIYEGFGSSYTKAKTIFDAIKLHFPNKRIITIFEPHTFSWRNKNTIYWYDDIFKDSDETIILSPPEHGKNEHDQISLEEILNRVRKFKKSIYGLKNKKEVLEKLEEIIKADDLIILMSSGDMYGLIEEIPAWVEKKFPK
jgi:UDP-N-acetylmuramate: L-alanyl-gamma-D-glutamyl-meso-diaminopimelate ligase